MDFSIKIKKIFGWELLFSLYPIMLYYSYGVVNAGDLIILVSALYVVLVKKKKPFIYRPIILLVIFILIHETILIFFLSFLPSYLINNTVISLLRWLLVLFIVPGLNEKKLYNASMIIAVICMGGLIYHFVSIYFFKNSINPLQLPFMPPLDESSRYLSELNRPTSFFTEPAAYASYMIIILAWCLYHRNIILGILITFTVLLSTSSNGFFQTLILWSFYLLLNITVKLKYKVLMFFAIIAIAYIVSISAFFESGTQKINNTNFDNDVRITAGFNLYKNMTEKHQLLGIDKANPFDYIMANPNILHSNFSIGLNIKDKAVFLPRFWTFIIKFGIIGIILYLYVFLFLFFKYKELRPYIFVWLISIMVQTGDVVFPMVFMLVIYRKHLIENRSSLELAKL